MSKARLSENWIHLGLGATAEPQQMFDGMQWYGDYAARTSLDGAEGRLVSQHSFSKNWEVWEMHPEGSEVVLCTQGEMTLIQEIDGEEVRTTLESGEYAINPAGVWHTADIANVAEAVFITAGKNTQHRPRDEAS